MRELRNTVSHVLLVASYFLTCCELRDYVVVGTYLPDVVEFTLLEEGDCGLPWVESAIKLIALRIVLFQSNSKVRIVRTTTLIPSRIGTPRLSVCVSDVKLGSHSVPMVTKKTFHATYFYPSSPITISAPVIRATSQPPLHNKQDSQSPCNIYGLSHKMNQKNETCNHLPRLDPWPCSPFRIFPNVKRLVVREINAKMLLVSRRNSHDGVHPIVQALSQIFRLKSFWDFRSIYNSV